MDHTALHKALHFIGEITDWANYREQPENLGNSGRILEERCKDCEGIWKGIYIWCVEGFGFLGFERLEEFVILEGFRSFVRLGRPVNI